MKVEVELSEDVVKKFKALLVLRPMDGGLDTMISDGLEMWVNEQIIAAVQGGARQVVLERAAPIAQEYQPNEKAPSLHTRRKSAPPPAPARPNDFDAYDASGISEGLSDDEDQYEDGEDQARTRDPEAFIRAQGGLTEEAMDRDMRVSDPEHEAKVDASAIKEKKLTGSASYQTPEQLFAEHSGLPTPPPVAEDERAKKRIKKHTGKGRASQFTGKEENTI